MEKELKIVIEGFSGAGKTEISSILSSQNGTFQGNASPTVGVKIHEFSTSVEINEDNMTEVNVFLWDGSGDERYAGCWPAIAKDADGLVLVYNAFDVQQSRKLETYIEAFGKAQTPQTIMIIANKIGESETKPNPPKLPKSFSSIKPVIGSLQENASALIDKFNAFLGQCYLAKQQRIEAEENAIVNKKTAKPKPKSTDE